MKYFTGHIPLFRFVIVMTSETHLLVTRRLALFRSAVLAASPQSKPKCLVSSRRSSFMNQRIEVTVYPVSDLARAKTLYRTLLGVDPYADQAYYVGFRVGDQEIGLDPHGHSKGITGPVVYVSVADIQSSLNQLVEAGAQELQAVQDVGGGRLIASVKDADGNNIGLLQNP